MAKKSKAGKGPSRGNLGEGPTPEQLKAAGKQLRLGTSKNVSHFLSVLLRKLWVGPDSADWDEEFIERARVMAYIAQLKLKAIEAADVEKRLKAVEKVLAARSEGAEGAEVQ